MIPASLGFFESFSLRSALRRTPRSRVASLVSESSCHQLNARDESEMTRGCLSQRVYTRLKICSSCDVYVFDSIIKHDWKMSNLNWTLLFEPSTRFEKALQSDYKEIMVPTGSKLRN